MQQSDSSSTPIPPPSSLVTGELGEENRSLLQNIEGNTPYLCYGLCITHISSSIFINFALTYTKFIMNRLNFEPIPFKPEPDLWVKNSCYGGAGVLLLLSLVQPAASALLLCCWSCWWIPYFSLCAVTIEHHQDSTHWSQGLWRRKDIEHLQGKISESREETSPFSVAWPFLGLFTNSYSRRAVRMYRRFLLICCLITWFLFQSVSADIRHRRGYKQKRRPERN
jgi:hypothetical protein